MRKVLSMLALAVLAAVSAQADEVVYWNNVTLSAIRGAKTPPPRAARALAMVHAAVYDAVDAVAPTGFAPYLYKGAAGQAGGSPQAAADQAAHDVLAHLFPTFQAGLDSALAAQLATIAAGPAKTAGIAAGQASAAAMWAARQSDDGSVPPGPPPVTGFGAWVPTPPTFAAYLLPGWGLVKPFCMASGSQFRQSGPPALNTGDWAKSFNQVKELGCTNCPSRTTDQTQIALFWADGAGTETPPGHWNSIAQTVSAQKGLSLAQNARLFALLNLAEVDASIAIWDMKWTYYSVRPVTAIRAADPAVNKAISPDAAWTSLLATPPFPDYESGHRAFSDAAAEVLGFYFGDVTAFTASSDGLPSVTRSYAKFRDAAEEAGLSRIYGGIHFDFSTGAADVRAGHRVGQLVCQQFLKAVPGAAGVSASGH
jgi:hypothetical protein